MRSPATPAFSTDRLPTPRQITAHLSRICETDVVAAWHELRCISEAAIQANAIHFNTVISGCQKHCHWQLALHLLGSIEGQGIKADVRSYSTALAACSRAEMWEAAVTLFASYPSSMQPDVILVRASANFGYGFCEHCKKRINNRRRSTVKALLHFSLAGELGDLSMRCRQPMVSSAGSLAHLAELTAPGRLYDLLSRFQAPSGVTPALIKACCR